MAQILVVDDHADIRRLLSIVLGKKYTVEEASDGTTAIEIIRSRPPQIVLLDIMMPGGLDGLAVLAAIKDDPQTKAIWVAMLTARGQVADQVIATRAGADAYFVKPFSPLKVMAWVVERLP